ncbi:DNA adenine methylase [Methanococcoides methylutens]|uniref:site-specific DNA-methyltransferase (adenine-specific) n=1 Tax=Methanococcoides methylutens MM1 TaxID=1434104 RepID=A0A0E3SS98_METMT|nr:DNA adenine methylase [Methanococcoides methylutens]AKB85363.1 Site-specific DNA-methyltransferase [Methanococcoides methylutens MM1]
MNMNSPLPMQYLGSKTRISNWVVSNIKDSFPSSTTLIDLFGGSGSISFSALKYDYTLYINDVQPYSYIILKSIFSESRDGLKELANDILKLKDEKYLLRNSRSDARNLLEKETILFNKHQDKSLDWVEYKEFCETTPLLSGNKEEIMKLRKDNDWNLFFKYYANTYFGIKQCLVLDKLREYAEGLSPNLRCHLIASTISVMTFAVSSTTHLAQFLKPTSKKRVDNLINKRDIDIIDKVSDRLKQLSKSPLPKYTSTILNLDFKDALCNIDLNKNSIVYVDPPYFKEHYSRYYHVLDTFYLYDYPHLTINPRINKVTIGRYREDRFVSEFGLKSKVKKAFENLFDLCYECKANIVLSYADTSLLKKEIILEIAENSGYRGHVKQKKLMHTGQGQPRNKKVIEYLYFFEPNGD